MGDSEAEPEADPEDEPESEPEPEPKPEPEPELEPEPEPFLCIPTQVHAQAKTCGAFIENRNLIFGSVTSLKGGHFSLGKTSAIPSTPGPLQPHRGCRRSGGTGQG